MLRKSLEYNNLTERVQHIERAAFGFFLTSCGHVKIKYQVFVSGDFIFSYIFICVYSVCISAQ